MASVRDQLARMSHLDRRHIFVVVGIAVTLPFLVSVPFRAAPSKETLRFATALDAAIASPKPVAIEIAFGNQTMAELEPIALAVMRKLFHEKKRVIFFTTYESAAQFTRRYLKQMETAYGLTYGEDYVFLGYAAAYTAAMYKMGSSIEEVFHQDDRGTPTAKLPLMRGVESLKDTSALIDIAANSNPKFWINFAVTPYNINLIVACTAVGATDYFPFIQTGQIKGLITGGRAGAELEGILLDEGVLDRPGDATLSLGSQSLALMVILGFIALGNIGYFAGRKSERAKRS